MAEFWNPTGLLHPADEGAQVARGPFISGHTWSFHTVTASSSRSSAWRTGTWRDHPCRRISFQVPSTVYPTWNRRPISVLILPRVQRWSPANPCASGPFRSSGFQPGPLLRAQLLPRHRALRPQRLRAAVPPGLMPPPHRPSVTRRSREISLIPSPRANRPAASSRSRSRRCCSAGVYPPRCAYRIPRSYARSQPTSRPKLCEFNLVKWNRRVIH